MSTRQYIALMAIFKRYRKIVYPHDSEFWSNVDDFKVILAAWHCSRMQNVMYPGLFKKDKQLRGRKKKRGDKRRDMLSEKYNEMRKREHGKNVRIPIFYHV